MNLLNALWRDEAGFVMSAEMVLLGTMGVLGATVGMGALATSMNDELKETAFAFRSLDQSYGIRGYQGANGSWTAGSTFIQRPVHESHAELQGEIDAAEAQAAERAAESENQPSEPRLAPQVAPEFRNPEPASRKIKTKETNREKRKAEKKSDRKKSEMKKSKKDKRSDKKQD